MINSGSVQWRSCHIDKYLITDLPKENWALRASSHLRLVDIMEAVEVRSVAVKEAVRLWRSMPKYGYVRKTHMMKALL